jgi:hypothetical protein
LREQANERIVGLSQNGSDASKNKLFGQSRNADSAVHPVASSKGRRVKINFLSILGHKTP